MLASIIPYICYLDWKYRKISNKSSILVFALCIFMSFKVDSSVSWAIVCVAVCYILYGLNVFAGGDIKLFIAFLPAISYEYILYVVHLIFLLGGAVVFLIYSVDYLSKSQAMEKRGVPFGIPISIACFVGVTASL
ncbi:prepilin peptidase [Vibrio agarivorans]